MDVALFDSLARAISASRRGTLRTLLGAPLGVLLAGWGTNEAAAGCKKVGKKCDKSKDCCDGAKCKGGKKGKCRCKSGLTECDGEKTCRDLSEDAEHCGACDNACADGETCCNGACVDLESDDANCGACNVTCGNISVCRNGECLLCQPAAPLCGDSCCPVGETCCIGVCVDLQTSRVNCGSCFNTCDFDEACIDGNCGGLA